MAWFRAFAWAYGIVCFALLALLPLAARAQALPAPAGAGWQWCELGPAPWDSRPLHCVVQPQAGQVAEIVSVRRDGLCSEPYSYGDSSLWTAQAVFGPWECYRDYVDYETEPDTGAGAWVRYVYLSAEPPGEPGSAASSPAATEATALQISSGLSVLAFLVVAGLGFMGYSVGARDA